MNNSTGSQQRAALASAIGCMVLWAFLVFYWKALIPINSWVLIIYRILLVFVSSVIMARVTGHSWEAILAPARSKKTLLTFFLSGLTITVNWSVYIWAVNSGHILQSSIGYYIEPLAVCSFGMIFFHEKLNKYKGVALGLATLSVIVILIHFRAIPGLSLGLAFSFAIYCAIKKSVSEPPVISLIYETVFLAPFALLVIIYLEMNGIGALHIATPMQVVLLLLIGFVTAIPLALFSQAAQHLSLFTVGLVEYVSPTLSMLIGIFFYKEPIDLVLFIAFAIIWIGLAFFTYGGVVESRQK